HCTSSSQVRVRLNRVPLGPPALVEFMPVVEGSKNRVTVSDETHNKLVNRNGLGLSFAFFEVLEPHDDQVTGSNEAPRGATRDYRFGGRRARETGERVIDPVRRQTRCRPERRQALY